MTIRNDAISSLPYSHLKSNRSDPVRVTPPPNWRDDGLNNTCGACDNPFKPRESLAGGILPPGQLQRVVGRRLALRVTQAQGFAGSALTSHRVSPVGRAARLPRMPAEA